MTYLAHRIIDHLFQGGYPPPGEGLRNNGVDVLVLCARNYQDASLFPGLEVILAPGDDDPRPQQLHHFIERWKEAGHLVAERVRAGKNVLVTCYAGQNRSGIVTALAMRELTGLKGSDIVAHIRKARPLALNNASFVDYLEKSFLERA